MALSTNTAAQVDLKTLARRTAGMTGLRGGFRPVGVALFDVST